MHVINRNVAAECDGLHAPEARRVRQNESRARRGGREVTKNDEERKRRNKQKKEEKRGNKLKKEEKRRKRNFLVFSREKLLLFLEIGKKVEKTRRKSEKIDEKEKRKKSAFQTTKMRFKWPKRDSRMKSQ